MNANTFWTIVLVFFIVCLISGGITLNKDFIKLRRKRCAVVSTSLSHDEDIKFMSDVKKYVEILMKILDVDYFKSDDNTIAINIDEALPKDYFDRIIIYSLVPGAPTSDEEAELIITLNGGDIYPFNLVKDPYYMLKYTIEKRFKSNGNKLTKIIYSYLNNNLKNASVTLLSKNQIRITNWSI